MTAAPDQAADVAGAGGLSSTVRMLGQVLGAALVAGFFQVHSAQGACMTLWAGVAFAALACVASVCKLLGCAKWEGAWGVTVGAGSTPQRAHPVQRHPRIRDRRLL